MLIERRHGDRRLAVLRTPDGETWLTTSATRFGRVRITHERPAQVVLVAAQFQLGAASNPTQHQLAVGGLMPPNAATVEVIDNRGFAHSAAVENCGWLTVLTTRVSANGPTVGFRGADGLLLPTEPPAPEYDPRSLAEIYETELRDLDFPVYAAAGLPPRLARVSCRARRIEAITVSHTTEAPGSPTLHVRTLHDPAVHTSLQATLARELERWKPMAEHRSASADPRHELPATTAAELIDVDGTFQTFQCVSHPPVTVAGCRLGEQTIVLATTDLALADLRLHSIDDPIADLISRQ